MSFDDAAAGWHMAGWNGSGNTLRPTGEVRAGIALDTANRAASLKRCGDGFVASLDGGFLSADAPPLHGNELSVCIRMRRPAGQGPGPLLSWGRTSTRTGFLLHVIDINATPTLAFDLETDWDLPINSRPLRVGIPVTLMGEDCWHDIVARFQKAKLDLFVDGALVDEEWPVGSMRLPDRSPLFIGAQECDNGIVSGFRGWVDHVAVWNRALSDGEITRLSGGPDETSQRGAEIQPASCAGLNYWKPSGCNSGVGDCMPFFHNGLFHLYYLFDRRHHGSKWGLGAHQWAHASTTDLVHWEHHPLAVPISHEWEGSVCTGSTFYHNGVFYAFYAVRMHNGAPGQISVSTSVDGVHFTKKGTLATLRAPYEPVSARDPKVFHDQAKGLFHMLITTSLVNPPVAGHGGCLAHLVSVDLHNWEQTDPFIVPGYTDQPECPDYFRWNDWHYLIFSNHGVARYRMARKPSGPWLRPKVDVFDGPQACVLKTAAFTDDRRIGVAWIGEGGWAGHTVFREITQQADGSLRTKWVAEMVPAADGPLPLSFAALTQGSSFTGSSVSVSEPEGFGSIAAQGLPRNLLIHCRITPAAGTLAFGLCIRGCDNYSGGHELRFEPLRAKVGWRHPQASSIDEAWQACLYDVDGLDRPFILDVLAREDILDICIGNRRTLVVRVDPGPNGDRLFFFAQSGAVCVEDIEIRPLL